MWLPKTQEGGCRTFTFPGEFESVVLVTSGSVMMCGCEQVDPIGIFDLGRRRFWANPTGCLENGFRKEGAKAQVFKRSSFRGRLATQV